jgi:hypothetical protein
MRTVLLLTFTGILLSSCSKYQYYTLASNNASKKNQQFVFENDTCKISYSFSGLKGPVSISVYNKTSKPLEVDWKKSALIVGDSSISFFEPQMLFNGEVERSRYVITDNITGTVSQPESVDFIPPQSAVTRQSSRYIRTKFIKASGEEQEIIEDQQKLRVHTFTKENSPVAFRIYLTLLSDNNRFNIEHSFYATEIIETSTPLINPENKGSNFYVTEKSGFGKASTFIFAVTLTALLVAAF